MSNFISDFMHYHSGTECHKSYLRWAAISALGASAGPRYRLLNGSYYIYPVMYIMLVGAQGNRKTYAMSNIKSLIDKAFPDYPIGADITTRDDIIRGLSLPITERGYRDSEGEAQIYHPLALMISEFKDFAAYSPSMMINFLVNVYDYAGVGKVFKCSTIKRGAEDSVSPFVSILACENTDWFLRRLKEGVVTGGFSRRFIVIYEYDKPDAPVPRIILPPNHEEIYDRMVSHLQSLHTTAQDYKWTKEAMNTFDEWYVKNFHTRSDDSTIAGFMSTKDQQLLKLCMLLDLAEEKPTYTITPELVEEGLAWYGSIEPNLIKLYQSGGRNELQAEWIKLMDIINTKGGIIAEKEFLRLAGKDVDPRALPMLMKHLIDSDQLTRQAFRWPEGSQVVRTFLITQEGFKNKEVTKAWNTFNQK